ncbi:MULTISPECIES: DUF4197 domain-containing protein [unclassified Pseudodesulfovibrio]|uniref:DUF4197 domain-containing protein n=1 Tax=unclassified Pseudodesulfovibrio TaxID=2661612 RepID=UPI0013E3CD48|nr:MULTISPECIES: DUF4197 domain-containing protein [unclassified Pseudodesulfovibrio]MCJ2164289.1 DUF4197 domain-containing protein [Pseudodesulfovibrio sp. S3-i]
MKSKYSPIPLILLLTILVWTAPGHAAWGDAIKGMGDAGATAMGLPYTPSQAEAGIKQVLSMGTDSAVSSLGVNGGFSNNEALALPLPDLFSKASGSAASGLVSALNSAAESSVPSLGPLFQNAIQSLDIGNPASMIGGDDDSITRYFENSARPSLKKLAKPIVSKSLDATDAGQYLNALTAAQQMSNLTGVAFDPVDYVTDRALDGMFSYIADTEKDIRSTGGAGASELLQTLF